MLSSPNLYVPNSNMRESVSTGSRKIGGAWKYVADGCGEDGGTLEASLPWRVIVGWDGLFPAEGDRSVNQRLAMTKVISAKFGIPVGLTTAL